LPAFFLRQLWMVLRLLHWAGCPLGTPTPSASGAWGAVFEALHRRARLSSASANRPPGAGRFRRAAEALPDGVLILDGHRAIEWMNLHAEACLGLKASVDTGSRITHLLREPEFLDYLDSRTIAASRWICTRNGIPGARCRFRRHRLPRGAPCYWCAT
jgi:two-component system phosphate regulon sensor histidine kinase PhoR